ncbi:MAG: sialate O-acetylesterase [Deltaproteobacteria bacterium]|jgi:lysophospholipase L1-like esterase|nr:sialate O-acetylesterase [Deltaproteobacteria bacterium]
MKRWLVGSLALNAAFLATALYLVVGAQDLFVTYFVDPGWERRFSFFEAHPIQPGDVVFLGDSITASGEWAELFPDLPVRNRGIGGDTTEGLLRRLQQITRGRPGKLFLLIGTNDLGFGKEPASIAENVGTLLGEMHRASPETALYVQSVLPRAGEYREAIEDLNRRLEGIAAAHGATWLDLYPHFLAGDGSLDDVLTNDELHLLADGYERWRDLLRPHLQSPG